jgi:hypothetical protein
MSKAKEAAFIAASFAFDTNEIVRILLLHKLVVAAFVLLYRNPQKPN